LHTLVLGSAGDGNSLGPVAGVTLAEAIGQNETLTSLYLYNNSIGMAAARGEWANEHSVQ
jgi:hypothetical protein